MLLIEFDLKFVFQKVIKGQDLIDHLVDAPSPFTFPNQDSFFDEFFLPLDVDNTCNFFFDGARC